MNKKLIAVAVAGVVASPAAYADISAYARINHAIDIKDTSSNNSTNLSNVGSRFGFKGSGDIGNGLSAFGRYEFSVKPEVTDNDEDTSPISRTRLAYVGLSGGFGSISVGTQWSSYFNIVGTHMSPTVSLGGVYAGPFRNTNTIQYSNSFGPVSLSGDLRQSEDAGGNSSGNHGYALGISVSPMDNLTLALGTDSTEDSDKDIVGGAVNVGFGNFSVALGHEQIDTAGSEQDNTQLYVHASLTDQFSMSVGLGKRDNNDGTEPSSAYVGATYKLGGGLRFWGETLSFDNDDGADNDVTTLLGIRIDF